MIFSQYFEKNEDHLVIDYWNIYPISCEIIKEFEIYGVVANLVERKFGNYKKFKF
jgi:hypothetical protein